MKLKNILYLSLVGLITASMGTTATNVANPVHASHKARVIKVNRFRKNHKRIAYKRGYKKHAVNPRQAMRTPISYRKSSETIPYPNHLNAHKDRIIVSLKKQRAYLMHGKKLLYEFYVSTGKNVYGRRTPKGHYQINGVHSLRFYSASEHEGARYAVGWHDGGLYLFHETPFNSHGKIIKSVARDLGKKGSSYGCVHLSTSDAKWFYYHIPTGMKVIIR